MAKRCLNSLKIGEVIYPLSSIDDYSFLGTSDYGETQVPPQRNTFIDIPSTFHLTSEPTFKIESDLTKKTYQIGNGGVLDYPRESGTDSYYGLYTGWLFYHQSTILCGDRFYPNYNFTKSTYLVIVVDDDTEDAWIVHISMNYDGKIRYFHLHPKNGNENILYTIFRTGIADSGGAGSGYIGNALVSNKKMVGYNVPTSSAESTKTESVNEASESPVSGKPKIGNGHARIKLLREFPTYSFGDVARTLDIDHKQTTGWSNSGIKYGIAGLSQYYGSDYILVTQQSNGNYFTSFDGIDGVGRDTVSYTGCGMFVPIKPIRAVSAKASLKIDQSSRTSPYSFIGLYLAHLENSEWTFYNIGSISISGTVSEWTELTKVFDSPINAEYILINVMDNKWHFKNLEITGELL